MEKLPYFPPSGKRTVEVLVVGNSWTTLTRVGEAPVPIGAVRTAEVEADPEALASLARSPGSGLVVVSVVPSVAGAIATKFPDAAFLVADRAPIEILYRDPATLGPDRLANALAARALLGAPALAVDCGTATTFTLVDDQGRLAGGAIAVGLGTARDALAARTARLPVVELIVPPPEPATDTVAAMQIGLVHGHAGLIRHLCHTLAPAAPVVLTGGWSALLAPLVPGARHQPHLTALGGRIFLDAAWASPRRQREP